MFSVGWSTWVSVYGSMTKKDCKGPWDSPSEKFLPERMGRDLEFIAGGEGCLANSSQNVAAFHPLRLGK